MASRHKFSVVTGGGCLVALVPDQGSQVAALARLVADDPIWKSPDVNYQGLVKWTGGPGPIDFSFVSRSVA